MLLGRPIPAAASISTRFNAASRSTVETRARVEVLALSEMYTPSAEANAPEAAMTSTATTAPIG